MSSRIYWTTSPATHQLSSWATSTFIWSPTDAGAVTFSSPLTMNNLVKVVQSPTHTAGHQLDVFVVRSNSMVTSVNVPPPVLSDHSMIDVALGQHCSNQYDWSFYTFRSWRSFSYDDFERDLLQSDLVRCPPDDVSELIAAYDYTLRSLIDIHAPYRRTRRSNRPSQYLFDAECRAANGPHSRSNVRTATTTVNRLLERCLLGSPSLARNVVSFSGRRPNTSQLLLRVVRVTHGSCGTRLTKSSSRRLHPSSHTVLSDLAMHFVGKVDKIRANTTSAPPPRVVERQCASGLSTFQLVTTGDIRRLILRAPCKHCHLDTFEAPRLLMANMSSL